MKCLAPETGSLLFLMKCLAPETGSLLFLTLTLRHYHADSAPFVQKSELKRSKADVELRVISPTIVRGLA